MRQPDPVGIACDRWSVLAGIGLLNFADASYARAIGVMCLLAFGVTAFLAVAVDAVGREG